MPSKSVARLFSTTVLTAALAAAAAAHAQEAPSKPAPTAPAVGPQPGSTNTAESGQTKAPDSPQANNNGDGQNPTEVVVTGSRIKRADLTSAQPISVIGGQYIEDKGFTNLAQAINQIPGLTNSVSPVGDQTPFGTGRNYINLFDLGTNRTLTLVNGRRFISNNAASNANSAATNGLNFAPGSQVDLNDLPTAFIDRIETVQAGGSAIYGSDAVAGVVNIITKNRYTGFEVDGQYGNTDVTDLPEYRARVAFGTDFMGGRGNVAATFEWNETSPLLQNARSYAPLNYGQAANPANKTTSDGIPASILILNRRVPEVTLGGVPFATANGPVSRILTTTNAAGQVVPAQFALGGNLVPYNPGTVYQGSVADGGQGLSLADFTALNSPYDRYLAGGIASFEITPHIRLRGEFNFSHLNSTEPVNQPTYNSYLFPSTPNDILPLNANTNPFLSAAARTQILAQLPAANNGTFYLSRGSTDLLGANNAVNAESESYRGVLAVEGDFTLFTRKFDWNIFYNHGQSEGQFNQLQIDQTKFTYAVNAVTGANGQAVCAPLAAGATAAQQASYQGCAPLNLFGNGAPSAAALAYIQALFSTRYLNKEDNAQANISGSVWTLPGGDLQFNLGVEWRREEAKLSPNENNILGIGRSAAVLPTSGAFESKEIYYEINLPIFGRDFSFPLMRSLEFNFSDRHLDNTLAGEGRAYSYQAKYMPFKDLLIRGTRSRSFRAPSLTELFLPQQTQSQFSTDPCDYRQINLGANPAVRTRNCQAAFQALGLPASTQLTSISNSASINVLVTGNPNLRNEIAEQYSYGFVYQPHFIPHLAISADLTNIDLTDAISNFNLTALLSACYDNPTYPNDACGLFQRNNQGQLLANARTTYVNAGFIHFQGLNAQISYDFAPRDIPLSYVSQVPGRFGFVLQAFNNQRYEQSISGLGFDLVRAAGSANQLGFLPRWTGKLDVSYAVGGFRGLWTTRYVSSIRTSNLNTIETTNLLELGDYFKTDVSGSYKWKQYTFRAGINNLFDVKPPLGAGTSGVTYDFFGRAFFVGLNAKY